MKKRTKILIALLLFGIMVLMVFKYVEEIAEIKHAIASELIHLSQEPLFADFSELYASHPPFVHSDKAWYRSTNLIYHAGGGIDGLSYTNSKEAMQLAIQHGNVIEIDFLYTKDNFLVCAHEWEDITLSGEALTLSEFECLKICGKYTPMSAKDLIDLMRQHEDVYIVIDTKESDVVQVVQDLIRISKNQPEIVDRFIIQLYERGTKQLFLDLYPFSDESFLFSCYKYGSNHKSILSICMEENISVVTVPYGTWDADTINAFTQKGIILFEHTVNRPDHALKSKEKGIYGFYTDFLIVP